MLEELGFSSCKDKVHSWSMHIDPSSMLRQYLYIELIRDGEILSARFQLSMISITPKMQHGKNFGIFDLSTFGEQDDFQMPIFLSFLNGIFLSENGKKNAKITEYIRDWNIKDLLKT